MNTIETIQNEYILPADSTIIAAWAERTFSCISFRPAGKETLKCLERGAGAKPHSILDQSIKKKVLKDPSVLKDEDKQFNDAVDAFFAGFGEKEGTAVDLLMGLVGHKIKVIEGIEEKVKVDGIYLTQLGANTFDHSKNVSVDYPCKDNIAVHTNNNMPFLYLNTEEDKGKLISFYNSLRERLTEEERKNGKHDYLFTRLFFSGDYDVHDLIKDGNIVVTEMDVKHLGGLQEMLKEGRRGQLEKRFTLSDKDFTGEHTEDYCRVQHGPQYNYVAQMINENLDALKKVKDESSRNAYYTKLNVLVERVINMDLPAAMCECYLKDGTTKCVKWCILADSNNGEDLQAFYNSKGLQVKSTWLDQNERVERIIHVMTTVLRLETSVGTLRQEFKQAVKNTGKKNDDEKKDARQENDDEKKDAKKILLDAVPKFAAVYGKELDTYVQMAFDTVFPIK